MPETKDLGRLAQLPKDARDRVEAALTQTLERELGAVAIGGELAASFSRSKGLAFSRSKVTNSEVDRIRSAIDATVLQNLETLGDEQFAKFADRLTRLRGR